MITLKKNLFKKWKVIMLLYRQTHRTVKLTYLNNGEWYIDKGHLIGKLYCKLFLLTQSKFVFHLAKTQILRGDDFKSHIVLEKYAFL